MTEHYILQTIIAAVLSAVVGGISVMFVRVRKLEVVHESERVRLDNVSKRVVDNSEMRKEIKAIDQKIGDLHLCLVHNYIHRDDWTPTASMILKSLEKQREILARHDERMKILTKPNKNEQQPD